MKQIRCLYLALTENFCPLLTMITKPYTKWGFKRFKGWERQKDNSAKQVMQFPEDAYMNIVILLLQLQASKFCPKFGNFA